jgi:hypothetical protein
MTEENKDAELGPVGHFIATCIGYGIFLLIPYFIIVFFVATFVSPYHTNIFLYQISESEGKLVSTEDFYIKEDAWFGFLAHSAGWFRDLPERYIKTINGELIDLESYEKYSSIIVNGTEHALYGDWVGYGNGKSKIKPFSIEEKTSFVQKGFVLHHLGCADKFPETSESPFLNALTEKPLNEC